MGYLILDSGVPAQLRNRDQAEEGKQQLVKCRYGAMGKDGRSVRIQTNRQVVQDQVLNGFDQTVSNITVGQDLEIRNEDKGLNAKALQEDPVLTSAKVVAKMQTARWTVASENAIPARLLQDLLFNSDTPTADIANIGRVSRRL